MPAIKVGIPVSLTGQFQTQGRQALAGLRAWAEDVNQDGGIKAGGSRHQVEVVRYDDSSIVSKATEVVHRLIQEDRVDLLFGPYSAGLARAAAEIAAEHGRLLWNQGGAAEDIYQPHRRVVGILNGAGEYLAALPGLLRDANPDASTFAILRCALGAFSRQVSEGLEARALKLGFKRVYLGEFPPDQQDFSRHTADLLEADPDLVLVVGRIRHDIAVARSLSSPWAAARKPGITAVVASPIARFRAKLGEDVEGFVGPSQWEPPEPGNVFAPPGAYFGPSPGQVVKSLRRAAANAGVPVDYPMAQAYASGLVAQRCLAEAGSPDPDTLWQAATSLDFHTFFGRFKIDPITGRQIGRSVFLVQWQQGRKVVIWPPEHSHAKLELSGPGQRAGA